MTRIGMLATRAAVPGLIFLRTPLTVVDSLSMRTSNRNTFGFATIDRASGDSFSTSKKMPSISKIPHGLSPIATLMDFIADRMFPRSLRLCLWRDAWVTAMPSTSTYSKSSPPGITIGIVPVDFWMGVFRRCLANRAKIGSISRHSLSDL